MADDGYEIKNLEIQDRLRSIARKIGGALPTGWGFLLMLYDFIVSLHALYAVIR